MPVVFDNIDRDRDGPAMTGEVLYTYLNRSSRTESERVRNLIEDWISRYPEIHRASLVARLRSLRDGVLFSAFFELALHELLVRTGHIVLEIEPEVPASPYRPDFFVEAPDGTRFYLEAVTSMNETPEEAAAEARLNDAVRIIDQVDSRYHFLDLDIEGKPSQPVRLRRLRRALSTWIAALPQTEEVRDVPAFVYEEHGMRLTVGAFLRRTPLQAAGGAIGMQGMEPYWGTPGDGIREAVTRKASRYGLLNVPYVVAVNAMGEYQGEEDAIDAMFGSPCVVVRQYEDGRIDTRESRNPDGVWMGERGARKRGLSAVLSTERFGPWSVGQRCARLIRNPWATFPLPPVPLGVDEINPLEGKLDKVAGRPFRDIFALLENWPEDEQQQ